MLELKNVTKTFGTFKALDGLNLTVPKGAVYGLVGPNGAGKTTLLNILGGMDTPTSGAVWVDGKNIAKYKKKQLPHWGNCFCKPYLIPR